MTDYTKTTDFGVKDGLSTGNANKLVKGSEFDTEFDAIQTAVATKADKASPTFTGTVTGANLTINGSFKLADTSDDHYYTWAVNELTADRTVTMPLLTGNDTFVFEAHTATLTNKTFDLGTNTLTGSAAEFDAALQSDTFVFTSEVGSVVQAYDADLTALGALAKTDGNFIVGNGTTWVAESGSTARTSLGLGSLATASTVNNDNWSGTDLAVTNGGTGASTAVAAAHALIDGISLTAATVAGTDKVLIQDTDGSDVLKTVTAQSIADLAASSGFTLITSTNTSAVTNIDFTDATAGLFDGTYNAICIKYWGVVPATDNAILRLRLESTVEWEAGASDYSYLYDASYQTNASANYDIANDFIPVSLAGVGSDTNEYGCFGEVWIYQAEESAKYTHVVSRCFFTDPASQLERIECYGQLLVAAAVTGVRFYWSTGDFETGGRFVVYGVD